MLKMNQPFQDVYIAFLTVPFLTSIKKQPESDSVRIFFDATAKLLKNHC